MSNSTDIFSMDDVSLSIKFDFELETDLTWISTSKVTETNFHSHGYTPDWMCLNSWTRKSTNSNYNDSGLKNSQESYSKAVEDPKILEASTNCNYSDRSDFEEDLEFNEGAQTTQIREVAREIQSEIRNRDLNEIVGEYAFDKMNQNIYPWEIIGKASSIMPRKSPEQTNTLIRFFNEVKVWSKKVIFEIAATTCLTDKQVYKWYRHYLKTHSQD